MTDDLHAAVQAEIDAYRPGAAPDLGVLRGRRTARRRRTAAAVAAAAAVSGVAVAVALPGDRPAPAPPPVAVTTDPPRDVMLSCRTGPSFPPSALDAPPGAERADDPAAAALRKFLRDRGPEDVDFAGLPATGWRRLATTTSEALFAAGEPRHVLHFELGMEGWRWSGSGSCERPEIVPPRGTGVASWAPRGAVPPDATAFTALVTEQACASGQSPVGRIEPPVVEYGATTVTVTFFVRDLGSGARTCQGNPAEAYEVRLREPLGGRTLLDGHRYPPVAPRDAGKG